MFVELIGTLYCPEPHEPTLLLAAVDRIAGRNVELGTLACPVCDRRYPIINGVAVFDAARFAAAQAAAGSGDSSAMSGYRNGDEMRAAALLNLTEPGGLVLATGAWSGVAEPLQELAGVTVVVLNSGADFMGRGTVSPIYANALPFGRSAFRGVLLDAGSDGESVAATVRSGGRLVGPVALAVPSGSRELARDAELWVAERVVDQASPIVGLRRAERDQAST